MAGYPPPGQAAYPPPQAGQYPPPAATGYPPAQQGAPAPGAPGAYPGAPPAQGYAPGYPPAQQGAPANYPPPQGAPAAYPPAQQAAPGGYPQAQGAPGGYPAPQQGAPAPGAPAAYPPAQPGQPATPTGEGPPPSYDAAHVGNWQNPYISNGSAPAANSVAAYMPTAPPMDQTQDKYTSAQGNVEDEYANDTGNKKEDNFRAGDGYFFTPQEMATLNDQPPPYEYFRPDGGKSSAPININPPTVAAQPASTGPLITTAAGFPIQAVNTRFSTASTRYDGWSGVKSCDPILQRSVDEIMLFLQTHNSRPNLAINIWGYHYERRRRTRTNSDGKTETYYETVTVTDFAYSINLTHFIFPFGFIQSVRDKDRDGVPDSIPDIINDYIMDDNKLKTLSMEKVIGFDFEGLRVLVYAYIRMLGWRRGLRVSYNKANYRTRVYEENCLSSMWENCFCKCLCHVTIIPCIVMRCYQHGHKERGIKSFFKINYQAMQVFEIIKPGLWAPGFRCLGLLGIFADTFWC